MEQAIELPVWTLLPFVALLLAIALVPLVAPHFWESNRNKGVVVALLSVPIFLFFPLALGERGAHELLEKGAEYVSFHCLLGSLFVVTNCGGMLMPLADPPLFLGFLKRVPFE